MSMLNADLIIGIFAWVVGGVVFVTTRELSPLGGMFVNYVLVAIFFLGALMLLKGFIKPEKIQFFESAGERRNIIIGVVMLVVYLYFMPKAGFLPTSYIFYMAFNMFLAEAPWARKSILQSAALSAVVVTFFYMVFHYGLGVPLPAGAWWE